MKRTDLVSKLIKEGFSEKTLVNFSDKQLNTLSKRIFVEQEQQGSVSLSGNTVNPQKIKDLTSKGNNVTIGQNQQVGEDSELLNKFNDLKKSNHPAYKGISIDLLKPNETYYISVFGRFVPVVFSRIENGKTFFKNEKNISGEEEWNNSVFEKVENRDDKKVETKKEVKKVDENLEIKKWVRTLAEKNYHQFTSKNEIMELIQTKMNEVETMSPMPKTKPTKGHNGIPEFMTYGSIKKTGNAGNPTIAPTKPKVVPGTKPGERPKPKNPFQPGPHVKPKPKAGTRIGENEKK